MAWMQIGWVFAVCIELSTFNRSGKQKCIFFLRFFLHFIQMGSLLRRTDITDKYGMDIFFFLHFNVVNFIRPATRQDDRFIVCAVSEWALRWVLLGSGGAIYVYSTVRFFMFFRTVLWIAAARRKIRIQSFWTKHWICTHMLLIVWKTTDLRVFTAPMCL